MLVFFVVFLCPAFGNVQSNTDVYGKLFGQGVCAIRKDDMKEVPVSQIHLYPEVSYSLCWHFPPWCLTPTGRELKESINVTEDIKHEILSLKCCSGYYPSKDDLSCLPICSHLCLPDKCLSPNDCSKCQTGYHGPTCVQDTPSNVTSTTPAPQECVCPNENYMCNSEKQCVCANGFDGPSCQHIIPSPHIIVNPGGNCWYYAGKVSAMVLGLAASAILVAVLMKKRVCWRNIPFEPLDDRNVPSV